MDFKQLKKKKERKKQAEKGGIEQSGLMVEIPAVPAQSVRFAAVSLKKARLLLCTRENKLLPWGDTTRCSFCS